MEMAVSTVYWIGVLGAFKGVLVGLLAYMLISYIAVSCSLIKSDKGYSMTKTWWRVPLMVALGLAIVFIPNAETLYSMFY